MFAHLNSKGLASLHSAFYYDTLIVSRSFKVINDDGTTGNSEYSEVGRYKCFFSFGEREDTSQESTVVVSGFLPIKIFTSIEVDVKKGDVVEVIRYGDKINQTDVVETYKGIANKSNKHTLHQEITFIDGSVA